MQGGYWVLVHFFKKRIKREERKAGRDRGRLGKRTKKKSINKAKHKSFVYRRVFKDQSQCFIKDGNIHKCASPFAIIFACRHQK